MLARLIVCAMALCAQPSFALRQNQQRQTQPTPQVSLQLRATLAGHTKSIDRIAFSPDGELIATSSEDGTVRLWNAHTGELKGILSDADKLKLDEQEWYRNKQYSVTHDFPEDLTGQLREALANGAEKLAISPDRQKILISRIENPRKIFGRRDVLSVWDIATGRLVLTFETVPHGGNDVYWSPNGRTIVVVGGGRTKTRLLDASTGRVQARLPYGACDLGAWIGDDGCQQFIFNADGSMFLKDKEPLKLWSANAGEFLAELKSAQPPARFSPTAKQLLVTRGKDPRTALLWEVVMK